MRTILIASLALLASCGNTGSGEDSDSVRPEGADSVVVGFDQEWVHFGAENRRTVDIEVEFPSDAATYSAIIGSFRLECPAVTGGCDHWDRYGNLQVVQNAGTEDETVIEIDRFITPYRTGFGWTADLTAYRPILTGTVTLRVFIDTWVSEGHSDGAGWLYSASFQFGGGPAPVPEPVAVVPVWGHTSFNSGVPADVTAQFAGEQVDMTAASTWELRSFISGHGFGGNDNCAEFCALDHTYVVDGQAHTREVWRDDCESTVTDSTQQGTWTYDRAGWCPGDQVFPWVMPLTTDGGADVTVSYDLENWTWTGTAGQPYYYMSAVLIGYE